MNTTLDYILNKYRLTFDEHTPMPIVLNRFYRQIHLIRLFKELKFKMGAEIGTEKGGYAKELCRGLPNLKLYCIDPWRTYKGYPEITEQSVAEAYFAQAKHRLAGYNCELIRKTSMAAVRDFKPDSLDFVFIDANHDFEYVVNDIIAWHKIVRPGGILCGHDYYAGTVRGTPFHIPYAVKAYVTAYKIKPWFVLHAENSMDCWMWIKP